MLDDDQLRCIAVWKMEGLTNPEIAARLNCALPTVQRRLRVIRKAWSAEMGETDQAGANRTPR
jgi:DNA-directed RNA polymerase specialized sigma24 family protein